MQKKSPALITTSAADSLLCNGTCNPLHLHLPARQKVYNETLCLLRSNKRATTIQKWVRMHIQRAKFRRDTTAGRRAAERAAAETGRLAAAVVIQKEARRWAAGRKVRVACTSMWMCVQGQN